MLTTRSMKKGLWLSILLLIILTIGIARQNCCWALPMPADAPIVLTGDDGLSIAVNPLTTYHILGSSGLSLFEFTVRLGYRSEGNQPVRSAVWADLMRQAPGVREVELHYLAQPGGLTNPSRKFLLGRAFYDDRGNALQPTNAAALPPLNVWWALEPWETKFCASLPNFSGLQTQGVAAARQRLPDLPSLQEQLQKLNEGFVGLSWGTKPEKVAGITPLPSAMPGLQFYRLPPETWNQVLGQAQQVVLAFTPEGGLVQGAVACQHEGLGWMTLVQCLGPAVMLEPLGNQPVLTTWFPGGQTRVEADDRGNLDLYLFSLRSFGGRPALEALRGLL
jgi:hypothetical protein